jgi:hypothetical protein
MDKPNGIGRAFSCARKTKWGTFARSFLGYAAGGTSPSMPLFVLIYEMYAGSVRVIGVFDSRDKAIDTSTRDFLLLRVDAVNEILQDCTQNLEYL